MKSFTLNELTNHLLNQTVLADTDFALHQQYVRQWIRENQVDWKGLEQVQGLSVNEFDYSFYVRKRKSGLPDWLVQLFLKKKSVTRYKFCHDNHPDAIHVKISLKRNGSSDFITEIDAKPPFENKPGEIYVTGKL
jgi:hypothetical protein